MATRDIFKNLLDKSGSGFNVGELLGTYFSSTGKRNNRMRNILGLTTLFGLKEDSMRSNALKNLKENEKLKVFDQAKVTNRWNAYEKLINDDKAYRKNNNYFYQKAEGDWAATNPNYETDTAMLGDKANEIKNKDIQELADKYLQIHNSKLQQGNITDTNYMTKEVFFQPFENYYDSKQQSIAAPENISLVHSGFKKFKNLFNKPEEQTQAEINAEIALANRDTFGYLVEPDNIEGSAGIIAYRKGKLGDDEGNISKITLSPSQAKTTILKTQGLSQDQKNYLIRNIGNEDLTANELQAKVTVLSADFNPYLEERIKANKLYDGKIKANGQTIPKKGEKGYQDYVLRKMNHADIVTKQGDEGLNKLRSQMFTLKDLMEDPVGNAASISYLEGQIQEAGMNKVEYMALTTSMQSIVDPDIVATIKLQAKTSDKTEQELLSEHQQTTYSSMLDFADAIFKTPIPRTVPEKRNQNPYNIPRM